MQSTGKSAAPDPPMHAQLSSQGADIATLNFANDRYLWASEAAMQPIRGHCDNCRLLSRLKRNRGNRRFQLHPVILPVLVAAATTYLLLRCAWHLGASKKHNGLLRSVAAVGEEGEGCEEPCVQGFQGEPTVAAVEGEVLEEERVLERTRHYTLDLVQVVLESRSVLLRLPPLVSAKVLTNLLRLCIMELSALCSLLEPRERQTVEHAVEELASEVTFLRGYLTRKRASRAKVRHINRMLAFLRELPGIEFTGAFMTPVERLSKFVELTTLQQIALTQVQGVIQCLAGSCQQEAEACFDEVAELQVDALCKTTETRRNQVFQDTLLSKWLRDKHSKDKRYGLASPLQLQEIITAPPKPHKELLTELLSTPWGLWQQQSSRRGLGQGDVHADVQVEPETVPSPPKGLSTSEAFRRSGEDAGVGASVDQRPETSGTSNIPALAVSLSLAGDVADSAVVASRGAAYSIGLTPLYSPSASLQVDGSPATTWMFGSHRSAKAFTSSEASSIMGMPLLLTSFEGARPLALSRWPLTSFYAKMSATVKASRLAITAERFRPSQSPAPRLSDQLAAHETPFSPASAEVEKTSKGDWAVEAVEDSLACQTQTPPGKGPQPWRGGSTVAPAEWGSGGQATEPTKQGLLDPHALGSPRSQLTLSLPGQSSGGLFVTQPSAEPSASGAGLVGMPDLSSIWRFDGSISDQAALQRLPSGFSTPAPSTAASAGWRLPGMDFGYFVKHPGEQGIPWIPFRGVAVGEPEGGINEQEAGPAAHVAAVLFDPTSADFSKSLLSLKAPNGGADGK